MSKKYFIAFCTMDSKHLRSNPFFHSCLLLIEGDVNTTNEIIPPLRVMDCYGFYSHELPKAISFISDPFSYLTQRLGFHFRLRGSYGEWRHEAISDLSLGKGLSGRLFEISEQQINAARTLIQDKMAAQADLLKMSDKIEEREEEYDSLVKNEMIMMSHEGADSTLSYDELYKKAQKRLPISKFSYSVTNNANTCKIAAIDLIRTISDTDNAELAKQINALEANQVTNTLPRYTHGLRDIIINAYSTRWVAKGNEKKYPHLSWEDAKNDSQFSMIIADFGNEYVSTSGEIKKIRALPAAIKELIHELKLITRLCQVLNVEDPLFANWQKQIHEHIIHLSQNTSYTRKQVFVCQAKLLTETIMEDKSFIAAVENKIPPNFTEDWENIREKYTISQQKTESDESDYSPRLC